jgi:hypothetical protein
VVQVDLDRPLAPLHYALRHGPNGGKCRLRNWQLQGSIDGQEWEVLMTHTNGRSLPNKAFSVAHWPMPNTTKACRCFRIL